MSYSNWDALEEYEVAAGHRGVRARRGLGAGEIVGIYDGEIRRYTVSDGQLVDAEEHAAIVQIALAQTTLFGLVNSADTPLAGIDFLNHSCESNVIARDRIVITTAREVPKHEPLTIDYRSWDFIPEGIECWCLDKPQHQRCAI